MNKIIKSISKNYLPVIIDINILEKLIELFDLANIKYFIETENYRYDSLNSLINSKNENKISSLSIYTIDTYISIRFDKLWATVYISSDDPYASGLFYKIDTIINESKRRFSIIYSYYFIWSLIIAYNIFDIINNQNQFVSKKVELYFLIIYILYVIRALYIRLFSHSTIQMIKKRQVGTFFYRKRDDLILMVISAIIGAIVTVFVMKYFN